ncbi:hypothetical protein BV25DRAFT_977177 [Artomyces pyxidatus]|uniref:Uncharacterized protein n=1 Tax=Artomyces pyxidatus TaxID=48021 RepID=A0ACB8SWW1_9AGAM|nr:hypothetical protein BV25DRAFT_977177 [Artomyces pyxidatus]
MSPKKSHEVSRMTAYIQALISSRPALNNVKHIVDVGAGQGYLSRALRDLGFHVLALDGNAVQTKGAERRDRVPPKGSRTASHGTEKATDLPGTPHDARRNSSGKGSLSHQTIYITASTLQAAVSSWLHSEGPHDDDSSPPIPVLIVALHACGSLTPDIFRAFFACRADSELLSVNNDTSNHPERMSWLAKGAVIVGCCYNLLEPEVDFPLSRRCSRSPPLTASHLQLAAQIPSHWLDNATSRSAAYLSVKKVAYRALLEAFLPSPEDEHHEEVIQGDRSPLAGSNFKNRLGRLSDSAYTSFPHFLSCAFAKLGTSSSALPLGSDLRVGITGPCVDSPDFRTMQQRVEVLHVLRCLIGPSVESLILLDRIAWLKETLQDSGSGAMGGTRWDVELVNLFDQAMGSGRNTALLVAPFE